MKLRENFLKTLSVLLLSSSLVGCGLFQEKEIRVVETEFVPREIVIKERPKPMTMLPFHIYSVSRQNLDQFLTENKDRNGSIVFMAMDVKDYENLSLNMAEIKRYMDQQSSLLLYYEGLNEDISPPTEASN